MLLLVYPSRTRAVFAVLNTDNELRRAYRVGYVRELALSLPRSYEAVVRGRVKFRIGQIVCVAFSHDGETMGFAFPKELRDALVRSEPHKSSPPSESDMRFNWVEVRLAAVDADEMRDLVEGAWAMCVPKRVVAEYAASQRER